MRPQHLQHPQHPRCTLSTLPRAAVGCRLYKDGERKKQEDNRYNSGLERQEKNQLFIDQANIS